MASERAATMAASKKSPPYRREIHVQHQRIGEQKIANFRTPPRMMRLLTIAAAGILIAGIAGDRIAGAVIGWRVARINHLIHLPVQAHFGTGRKTRMAVVID